MVDGVNFAKSLSVRSFVALLLNRAGTVLCVSTFGLGFLNLKSLLKSCDFLGILLI